MTAFGQELSKTIIQHEADTMLISTDFTTVVIKHISPEVNGFHIALIESPYREFPSILIFHYDSASGWRRVYEGLDPGIQPTPNDLYEWHSSGAGIDFTTTDSLNSFQGTRIEQLIQSTNERGAIMIPYETFLHVMVAEPGKMKNHTSYAIDKTQYLSFARQLFDESYSPDTNCRHFYTPEIADATLQYEDDRFVVTALTTNGQKWIYQFEGVDTDFKFLTNKRISVTQN